MSFNTEAMVDWLERAMGANHSEDVDVTIASTPEKGSLVVVTRDYFPHGYGAHNNQAWKITVEAL